MPIYEYSCQKCGEHLEVTQKITDKPLARHPKCGGKLEKEWSRTGFQFKGAGWYVTDYAGKKMEAKEDKETKPDSSEAKKPDTSESKTKSKDTESKSKEPKESKGSKLASAQAPTGGD